MLTTTPKFSTPLGYRMDSAIKSEVKLKTETKTIFQKHVSFLTTSSSDILELDILDTSTFGLCKFLRMMRLEANNFGKISRSLLHVTTCD